METSNNRNSSTGPVAVRAQYMESAHWFQHPTTVQPSTVSPVNIPREHRQQQGDRSAVVLVDIGMTSVNGEQRAVRLLPRYRKPKRQRRLAAAKADASSSLVPPKVVITDVTSHEPAVVTTTAYDGENLTTDDDENGQCGRGVMSEKRLQRRPPEARPLLFQQQQQQQQQRNTSELLRHQQPQRKHATGSSLCTSPSGGIAGENKPVNGALTEDEGSFSAKEQHIPTDRRRKITTTTTGSTVTAKHNWRRIAGLVSSLKDSDGNISTWWRTVRLAGGDGDSNQRRAKESDDERRTPSSLELSGTKNSKISSALGSGNDDDQRENSIHRVGGKAQPLIVGHNQSEDDGKSPYTVDATDDNELSQKKRLRRERCVTCCRNFIAFLFSTVGSCCVLVGYVVVGGLMFRGLEAENEMRTKNDMRVIRLEHIRRLWNVTEEMNVLHPDAWSAEAERILNNFTTQVYTATKKFGWDGKDESSEQQWSYPGALLYSITVITTIGYGHIAPKTTSGQVVTMLYAIVGIPLTLFTITNLGSIMATAFRFLYKYICCGLCCLCCRRRTQLHRKQQRHAHLRHLAATMRTGNGSTRETRMGNEDGNRRKTGSRNQGKNVKIDVGLESGEEAETFRKRLAAVFAGTKDITKVSVPIYVSLLLMTGYILLGATLFWLAEDWNFLIAAYFCFITLSTIGFGDYVPGNDFTASSVQTSGSVSSSSSSPHSSTSTSSSMVTTSSSAAGAESDASLEETWRSQKLVVCALYLVCGLALMAMCFDLMQEEAKNKFRRLGRRLGLLSDAETG